MNERRISKIKIENARLIFKNFQGKRTEYNDEGNRNFGVILDPELADQLFEDGWNVKRLKPLPDDPEGFMQPWLSVKVRYSHDENMRSRDPIAVLITSKGKINLDEDTIGQIDWTMIRNVDLVINPYQYPSVKGRPAGISAYLKAIYVTVEEDDFEEKYGDIPYIDG